MVALQLEDSEDCYPNVRYLQGHHIAEPQEAPITM